MANKINLGIGAVITLLVVVYFGVDLNQNQHETAKHQTQSQSNEPSQSQEKTPSSLEQSDQPSRLDQHSNTSSDDQKTQYSASNSSQNRHGLEVIRQSFDRKISNVQVQSEGRVKAILRDDNEGSRHQKFILSLDNGLTILVAHNIDLSPRIENLKKGDMVEFFGEYEYSPQGGVMHWTHHDPRGRHTDGWLKHQGKTYK